MKVSTALSSRWVKDLRRLLSLARRFALAELPHFLSWPDAPPQQDSPDLSGPLAFLVPSVAQFA
jgi:hypothetical protein